jgi:ABC-type uncharacterized transport system permease subunit
MAELLFWPAVIAYGEAAVAFVGVLRRPELATRLAIWGVRVGWLAQTALLVAQASRAEGFAWSTWSGLLNLFVWLVVGAYLIWGCSARYRLLGLAVMPLAFGLFVAAAAGGALETRAAAESDTVFLALHVGFVLAGFAGFTLAAALSSLYLWQERRLKTRSAGLLRLAPPSLLTLDGLAARTTSVALALFTVGLAAGFARLRAFDAAMIVAVAAWVVYALALLLRRVSGWNGRRSARVAVCAFGLVVILLAVPHLS